MYIHNCCVINYSVHYVLIIVFILKSVKTKLFKNGRGVECIGRVPTQYKRYTQGVTLHLKLMVVMNIKMNMYNEHYCILYHYFIKNVFKEHF